MTTTTAYRRSNRWRIASAKKIRNAIATSRTMIAPPYHARFLWRASFTVLSSPGNDDSTRSHRLQQLRARTRAAAGPPDGGCRAGARHARDAEDRKSVG